MILATGNKHKLREMRELLPGLDLQPLDPEVEMPPENGDSFAANALIKARAAHAASGEPVIAEPPTDPLREPDVAPPAVDSIDTASPSARFLSDTAPPARPPVDQARLEARIQRLDALVERLIASQERVQPIDPEIRDTPVRLIGPAKSPDGKLIRDAATQKVGDKLKVKIWRGALECEIEQVQCEGQAK